MPYISQIGKIIDNVDHQSPLCTINVTNFAMYYYNIYKDVWFRFQVDTEEIRLKKIPKYFKYVYVGEDKYVLLGGFDVDINASSNKTFFFQDGHFARCENMAVARQYFGLALDKTYVYTIGGYNSESGVLPRCERMDLQSRQWEEIEPINSPRMNTAAIRVGEKYIYIFGGQCERGYVDNIERYNHDLNIWTQLEVSLPERMANLTAMSITPTTIMLLGGLKYIRTTIIEGEKEREIIKEEIDKNAYLFDTRDNNITMRVFCHFKKKLQAVQVNGKGHIYCLYMNNNKELPRLFVADLNEIYPDYSAYSWMLKLGYRERKPEKIVVANNEKDERDDTKPEKDAQSLELIELK